MDWFDFERLRKLSELTKEYEKIGGTFLRSIEESAFRSRTCHHPEMLPYYQYWERRVFNAITKMIIRALAVNKAILLNREIKPLIRMEAGNNHLEIIYQPATEEMHTQLEKFHKGIIESTKFFGRWKNETCKVFLEQVDNETSEKMIKYTFYDDVIKNPVITALSKDIIDQVQKLVNKFDFYNSALTQSPLLKQLYDTNKFNHEQRKMEKHMVDTQQVELNIIKFRMYKHACQ
jgi:dynein heavy chain